MVGTVARDSLSAWRDLLSRGGLELDDRDKELIEELRARLVPSAASLEEALCRSSTDQLVRALLDLLHPYADMFRAVLDFFRKAGARQGRDQWEIVVEEEHLDLKDFESFLTSWERIEAPLDLPAIDFHGAWILNNSFRSPGRVLGFLDGEPARTGFPDVDQWLAVYAMGVYRRLPTSLHFAVMPPELRDAARILWVGAERLRAAWPNRKTLMEGRRTTAEPFVEQDGLCLGTLTQNETDYWLGSSAVLLARALKLDRAGLAVLGTALEESYSRYPRFEIGITADLPSLERILSLPVWKYRHELYAVWIATEMVESLADHEVKIHEEDGRIVFAFRETEVARILSARPEKRIMAERRVPLADPIGKGRKGHVQPDYGIWTQSNGGELCGLIVEVKHYKRDSPARFREVLSDYARAHPNGTILLVSHGPIGDWVDGLDEPLRGRCRMLGDCSPGNVQVRDAFRAIVRDHVGDPAPLSWWQRPGPTALLIDISRSMDAIIQSDLFEMIVETTSIKEVAEVALADDRIRRQCTGWEAVRAARAAAKGGTTSLETPVRDLLTRHSTILVMTDEDGLSQLAPLDDLSVVHMRVGGEFLLLRVNGD